MTTSRITLRSGIFVVVAGIALVTTTGWMRSAGDDNTLSYANRLSLCMIRHNDMYGYPMPYQVALPDGSIITWRHIVSSENVHMTLVDDYVMREIRHGVITRVDTIGSNNPVDGAIDIGYKATTIGEREIWCPAYVLCKPPIVPAMTRLFGSTPCQCIGLVPGSVESSRLSKVRGCYYERHYRPFIDREKLVNAIANSDSETSLLSALYTAYYYLPESDEIKRVVRSRKTTKNEVSSRLWSAIVDVP